MVYRTAVTSEETESEQEVLSNIEYDRLVQVSFGSGFSKGSHPDLNLTQYSFKTFAFGSRLIRVCWSDPDQDCEIRRSGFVLFIMSWLQRGGGWP